MAFAYVTSRYTCLVFSLHHFAKLLSEGVGNLGKIMALLGRIVEKVITTFRMQEAHRVSVIWQMPLEASWLKGQPGWNPEIQDMVLYVICVIEWSTNHLPLTRLYIL